MPGVTNWEPHLYFESEAKRLLIEYNQVKEHERNEWFKMKEDIFKEIKEEIEIYRKFHSEFKYNCYEIDKKKLLEIEAENHKDELVLKEFKNFTVLSRNFQIYQTYKVLMNSL